MSGRLPIAVDLHPDETLEGFLERTAVANQIPAPALLNTLTTAVPALVVRFARLTPHPTLVTAVARTTGAHPERVRSASLARFDGSLPLTLAGLDYTQPAGHRPIAARGWLQPRTTQLCPPCLNQDGIWRVSWRLHTSIACPTHQSLLAATCPTCGHRFRDTPRGLLRPHLTDLTRCGNPTGGHTTCQQPLDELAAHPATPAELAYQQAHDDATTVTEQVRVLGRQVRPATLLAATRSLAVLLLHLLQGPPRRWALAPPEEARERADVLVQAHQIVTALSLEAAAGLLRPHLVHVPLTREGSEHWASDHMTPSTVAAEIAERALHPTRRLSHQLRGRTSGASLLTTAVPQVLPLDLYRRHLADHLAVSADVGRAFGSLALVTSLTGNTWADAAAELGLPRELGTRLARTVSQRTSKDGLARYIEALARDLDPSLDYRALEREIAQLATSTTWYRTWTKQWRPGSHASTFGYVLTWLWSESAAAHLQTSPAWAQPPTAAQRANYRQFARSLTPAAAHALHDRSTHAATAA